VDELGLGPGAGIQDGEALDLGSERLAALDVGGRPALPLMQHVPGDAVEVAGAVRIAAPVHLPAPARRSQEGVDGEVVGVRAPSRREEARELPPNLDAPGFRERIAVGASLFRAGGIQEVEKVLPRPWLDIRARGG